MYIGGIVFSAIPMYRPFAASAEPSTTKCKRRYRMRRHFTGLFGNEATKARIGAAIATDTVPHAFLIDGHRGSGKYTFALELAAALNCENKHSEAHPLPCRTCSSCRRILGLGHVDVHTLSRAEGKATIGVDEVKSFRQDMFLSATEAEHKVYIIREADRLTPEAQNALLIVLEEPPRGVVIMLLAGGTDKILTTIKSRAQYIPMERFGAEEIEEYLMREVPEAAKIAQSDRDGFRLALMSADGRIGRAKELITPGRREEIAEEREITLGILRCLGKSTPFTALYRAISALPTKRQELSEALERLMDALRDLISLHYDDAIVPSFFVKREEALELSDNIGQARLNRIYDIVLEAHADNTKNANITTLVTSLASRIKTA